MSRKILVPYLTIGLALLLAPLAGSSPAQAPPPASSGGTLTASFDNPELGHMDFTITGADLKMKGPNPLTYEGTSTGTTITLSGHMSFTEPKGYKTYLSLGAQLGAKTWHWPAKGGSEEFRGPRTVSESFNLPFTVGSSKVYATSVTGSVLMQLCGGICSGYRVDFLIALKKPAPAPTRSRERPSRSPSRPAGRRSVAFALRAGTGPPGEARHARVQRHRPEREGDRRTSSSTRVAPRSEAERVVRGRGDREEDAPTFARLAKTLVGPLFFCVWAENAEGLKSQASPKSSCAWVPLLVDVKNPDVSNGCGGKGWDELVAAENYLGNVHTYKDLALGTTYTVDFTDACDLHDAGYGGAAGQGQDQRRQGRLPNLDADGGRRQVLQGHEEALPLRCEAADPGGGGRRHGAVRGR